MKENFVRDEDTGDLFLTPEGREILSSVPVAPPVGYIKQPSLADQIRAMVRAEHLARDLAAQGVETFEEADDFHIEDDDFDDRHPYEAEFDPAYPPASTVVAEPPSPDAASETPPPPPRLGTLHIVERRGGGVRGGGEAPPKSAPRLAQYIYLLCTVLTDTLR